MKFPSRRNWLLEKAQVNNAEQESLMTNSNYKYCDKPHQGSNKISNMRPGFSRSAFERIQGYCTISGLRTRQYGCRSGTRLRDHCPDLGRGSCVNANNHLSLIIDGNPSSANSKCTTSSKYSLVVHKHFAWYSRHRLACDDR